MNHAVFELFPCLLRANQNEIKRLKETSKQCKHKETDRTMMSSGYSKGFVPSFSLLPFSMKIALLL